MGQINPYHLGYKLFEHLIENHGFDEAMVIRESHNDITFLRCYADEEFLRKMNYFSYSFKKEKKAITIDDVSDQAGWEKVRDELINNVGLNRIPVVYVDAIEKNNTLSLVHEHDGRDLDLDHAERVIEHAKVLWNNHVKLFTELEDELWEI